jgi:hypothetical protein
MKGGVENVELNKINFEKFDSIDSFIKTINSRPKNPLMERADASRTGKESFAGTKSYEEAENLLKNGYTKPLEKIKNAVSKDLKIAQNRPRRTPYNAVVGFVPNVPNYLLGIPEQMIAVKQIAQKSKTISISYFIGNNCGTSTAELEKAGITMLNVINRLELSGIRVNLDVVIQCTFTWDELQICSINVKSYREHLDLKKLCFPIAHPSMLRRFGFAWLERSTHMENSFALGYGRGVTKENENEIIKNVFGENDFFITQSHVAEMDTEQLLNYINEHFVQK